MSSYAKYIFQGLREYRKNVFAVGTLLCWTLAANCQSASEIVQKLKMKLGSVQNYEARGKMKTNVAFIKAPIATVKVYYKKPDMLRIVNETGISFIPRGSVNINLNSILLNTEKFDVMDAGKDNTGLRVIKLLPKDDTADIVLSTIYVDEKSMLIKKSKTTTRENGTYELDMTYGKYAQYALPDKIVFSFNTKDYKLPKGITLDYDDGSRKNEERLKNKKGTVEITYTNYIINKT
jgi:outer membrane lipoprotein-sorting protein